MFDPNFWNNPGANFVNSDPYASNSTFGTYPGSSVFDPNFWNNLGSNFMNSDPYAPSSTFGVDPTGHWNHKTFGYDENAPTSLGYNNAQSQQELALARGDAQASFNAAQGFDAYYSSI